MDADRQAEWIQIPLIDHEPQHGLASPIDPGLDLPTAGISFTNDDQDVAEGVLAVENDHDRSDAVWGIDLENAQFRQLLLRSPKVGISNDFSREQPESPTNDVVTCNLIADDDDLSQFGWWRCENPLSQYSLRKTKAANVM